MKLPRRKFLHLAAGAAALATISQIAKAQTYPTRSIALVVPIAAGGAVDTAARIIAEKLQVKLRQSVVVENRPGRPLECLVPGRRLLSKYLHRDVDANVRLNFSLFADFHGLGSVK